MLRVSIIVAAYNAEAFLGRAIESALAQDEPSLEVIVVDDRSSDATVAVAQRHAERDGRVRVLQVERNGGPGFARNLALQAAQGEWIAILDADDAFRPARLSHLLSFAQAHGADVVADNLLMRDGQSGEITGLMFPAGWFTASPHMLTPAGFVEGNMGDAGHARLAYGYMKPLVRRRFMIEHGVYYSVSRFAEDYVLGLELLCAGARWLVTPEAWYEYDVRSNSLSVKVGADDAQAVIAAEDRLLAHATVKAQPELAKAIRRHRRSLELSIAWVNFADALKARDVRTAVAITASDVGAASHIATECAHHLARALHLTRS